MPDLQGLPEKYAPQLASARARLSLPVQVGLALREHRRRLGMSQRAYARARGLHRSMLARLEAGADQVTLGAVVDALEGTGFALYVGFADSPETPPPAAAALAAPLPSSTSRPTVGGTMTGSRERRSRETVPPEAWVATDLVARVRGGGRRFPAHRVVRAVDNPPMWWWVQEFFAGPSEPPQWYAPDMSDRFLSLLPPEDRPTDDAGAA